MLEYKNTGMMMEKILDEPLHGWYIHGKAPSGFADCSTAQLMCNLHDERDNLLLKRGLLPDDPQRCHLQTYEMFSVIDKIKAAA
ncbi:hypothetical protein Pmar_PMAR011110 [Perkinsus marinus ATCC 50983]|uniref:Uncharacterized protein n=1 Tax=Perkinsus marinus (strain ATCC 50983 / TXsc) TaxID=423536 RepID=C5KVQ9_PERM5|nr:hypothetical protein Pmar_PMAR011110 [Perkinsus marinus ATCC 50983]EER11444.1 hypothetical protein Pmar_PMAR011110 [Perkinsus marinus ATCC 50983]|eukprot:XP_002779649.1 hypothetical protein Pmar_PMAR011110 [Perkinsus marinus ATCC 50983]